MKTNINKLERIISIAAGGALATYGFTPKTDYKRFTKTSLLTTLVGAGLTTYGLFFQKKRTVSTRNVLLGAIGAALVVRGVTGFSFLYRGLGYATGRENLFSGNHLARERKGKKVDRVITVNAPVEKVYKFFSNFENFPQFMKNVVSVKYTGADLTHWVVKSATGLNFEYDARVKTNVPNEVISWESVSGELPNAGSVRFHNVNNNSTRLEVVMEVNPPGGPVGETIADLLHDPEKQIDESLTNFKRIIEGGKATGQTA